MDARHQGELGSDRRARRALVRGGIVAVCLIAGATIGAESGRGQTPSLAEQAILSFRGTPRRVEASFARIDSLVHGQGPALRAAALAHLSDHRPLIHYASVYALARTAEPGPSLDALSGLMGSRRVDDRALAAAKLLSLGNRDAIPVLITLLGSKRRLTFRDPPERAWQLAANALLVYTDQDFGLRHARTARAARRARRRWRQWWATQPHAAPAPAASPAHSGLPRLVRQAAARAAAGQPPPPGTTVSVDGEVVTITVNIEIIGKPTYRDPSGGKVFDHSDAWANVANDRFNKAFDKIRFHPAKPCPKGSHTVGDGGYKLKIEVHTRSLPAGSAGDPGYHHMTFRDNPALRSHSQRPSAGHGDSHIADSEAAYQGDLTGEWGPAGARTITHEIGHLAGLGDDYVDITTNGKVSGYRTLNGRNGSAMSDGTKIDQNLVNRIGKTAGKVASLPTRCEPDHKRIKLVDGNFVGASSQGKFAFLALRGHGTRIDSFGSSVKILCHNKQPPDDPFYANGGDTATSLVQALPVSAAAFKGTQHPINSSDIVDTIKVEGRFTDRDHAQGKLTFDSTDATHICPPVTVTWRVHRET